MLVVPAMSAVADAIGMTRGHAVKIRVGSALRRAIVDDKNNMLDFSVEEGFKVFNINFLGSLSLGGYVDGK